MNYIRIDSFDTANSHGLATILWVSHCTHHCKDCHNPETWSKDSGKVFDGKAKEELFEKISNPHIENVVFSGGDPFSDLNIREIGELIQEVRQQFPEKKVIVYTGFTIDELLKDTSENTLRRRAMKNVDFLIDGRFERDNKVKGIDLRGSYNQQCYMRQAGEEKAVKMINWSLQYFQDTTEEDLKNFGKKVILPL